MINTIRVVISGRVQGVGYRAWAVEQATHLGLSGWVRNRNDGTVEAVFSGDDTRIAQMVEACKQGPASSLVDSIESFACKEEVSGLFAAKPNVKL